MPRYEYGERFWSIELDGNAFTTTYVKLGTPGRSQRFELSTPAHARDAYDERIRDKTLNGYELVKPPRTKRGKELPSELADCVVWDGPRVRTLYLSSEEGDRDEVELLDAALATPVAKQLSELVLDFGDAGNDEPDAFVAVLAKHRPPLTKLTLGGGNAEIGSDELGDIAGFWPVVPALEELVVRGSQFELGDIALPALRDARFVTWGLSSASARAIGNARWPAIESLEVYTGDSHAGADCTVDDLAPLLARTDLTALASLGIVNSELANALVGVLPSARVIRGLTRLSLAFGTLDDDGARTLASHRAALAHLAVLDVHSNFITDLAILRGCADRVHSLGQHAKPAGVRPRVTFSPWKQGERDD